MRRPLITKTKGHQTTTDRTRSIAPRDFRDASIDGDNDDLWWAMAIEVHLGEHDEWE